MKSKNILLLGSTVLLLLACSKDFNEEFEENRNRFVGSWNVAEDVEQFKNGILEFNFMRELTLDLQSDGTAIEINLLGLPGTNQDTFQWYYQFSPEQIVFVDPVSGLLSNSVIYDVLSVDDNKMEWQTDYTSSDFNGNISDVRVEKSLRRM